MCEFSTEDMCGYMDVSRGRYHWLRDRGNILDALGLEHIFLVINRN